MRCWPPPSLIRPKRSRQLLQPRSGWGNSTRRMAPSGSQLSLDCTRGPCITVTLNGRLDYFVSTVNIAARLQVKAYGDDLVISERLASAPAVAPLIASCQARLDV